ncbi:hypothetical protein SARC_14776, partial [Sphaeroforma arctica JP610]
MYGDNSTLPTLVHTYARPKCSLQVSPAVNAYILTCGIALFQQGAEDMELLLLGWHGNYVVKEFG